MENLKFGNDTNKSKLRARGFYEQIILRECLLQFGPKSFFFPFAIQKRELKVSRNKILRIVLWFCENWSLA